MKKAFLLAGIAAAAAAVAPASAAVEYTVVLDGSGSSTTYVGSYTPTTNTPIVVPPSVDFAAPVDFAADPSATFLYEFSLGSTLTLTSSQFGVTPTNAPSINFTSLNLYTGYGTSGGSLQSTSTTMTDVNTGAKQISLGGYTLGPGKYTVALVGNASGSGKIGGTLSFQAGAVPEAATWAMMLVGFGTVGAALRTSRRKVSFA